MASNPKRNTKVIVAGICIAALATVVVVTAIIFATKSAAQISDAYFVSNDKQYVLNLTGDMLGYEDNGYALIPELPGDTVQLFRFALGQCGGRLVHNNDLCVQRKGLCDLHHLLLTDGQVTQLGGGVDLNAHLVELALCLGLHSLVVDQTACHKLTADEHVLSHGQVVHHVQLLVDHADAGSLGKNIIQIIRLKLFQMKHLKANHSVLLEH